MKIKIVRDDFIDGVNIYFYQENNGKKFIIPPIEEELIEIKECELAKPTIRLSGISSRELLESMAKELYIKNVKIKNPQLIRGQLEASEYHLRELKELLNL